MRRIFGFLIGLFAGVAACGVIFVLLSLIFRLPEGGQTDASAVIVDPQAALSSEAIVEAATQVAEPIVVATAAPAAAETPPQATESQTRPLVSFERNALPFNMPNNTRGLALVMVVPPGVDVSPLAGLPLTVAIDPLTQVDQIGAFRAMGFEVLTILTGETRNSVPLLSQAIASMTGSVGVLDREAASDPASNITLLTLLGEHGLAYLTQTGFGGILGPAGEAGLPAMAIGAQIDGASDLARARAALDRASIDAIQRGNQVVVVEMDANMVSLLLSWVDAPKPRGMIMTPVSAVLRRR